MTPHIHGLYAVIDPQFLPAGMSVSGYARLLLDGGCRLLQLRAGHTSRYALARELLALRRDYDFVCLINDDPVCARELRAEGVHLGQDDMTIPEARTILGSSALIGYSSHSVQEACLAQQSGADYVAFGAIYPTQTKGSRHPVQGIARLQEVVQCLSLPVVAIGGITRERVRTVVETGVAAVAMITGLSRAQDPRAEATWYIRQLSRQRTKGDLV